MNAEATVADLVAIVERLVESNEMIVNRILSSQVESETVRETDTLRETETIRGARFDRDGPRLLPDLTPAATAYAIYYGFDFDDQLENSRAYQRAAKNDDDFSFSAISSADRTASWSILSGISLSQVSNIAAVRLPIRRHEINNSEDYVFERPEGLDPRVDSAAGAPQSFPLPLSSPKAPQRINTSRNIYFVQTICPSATSYEYSRKERDSWFFVGPVPMLDFKEAEILLIHANVTSGWVDATSLRSQTRGWVSTKYWKLYEPEVLKDLMRAVVSLLEFAYSLRQDLWGFATPRILANLKSVSDIIAGVRFLLVSVTYTSSLA